MPRHLILALLTAFVTAGPLLAQTYVYRATVSGSWEEAEEGETGGPCVGSIGAVCADGTVYAGEFGGEPLFTTAADLGQFSWNNGSENWTETGATEYFDGLANTNALVALSDAGAPYGAANACRSLGADWYLPSDGELGLLRENRVAIGGFDLSGSFPEGRYWSSTEMLATYGGYQNFNDGSVAYLNKNFEFSVRCVRK